MNSWEKDSLLEKHIVEPVSFSALMSFSFLIWMFVAITHAIAGALDSGSVHYGQPQAMLALEYCLVFLPLSLLNCLLAWLFWRKLELMLQAKLLALLALLSCVAFLPILTVNKIMITTYFDRGVVADLSQEWDRVSPFILWVDFCLILLAFSTQASFAAWRRARAKEQEIELSRSLGLELRLHLLQGQLKPHFLFNALNSITALVRGEDRHLAGNALNQLNGLLRYVVNSGKYEWLSVADELKFVRDYLDMQSLRFGKRLHIEWEIQDRDWEKIPCAPLLFQPLVENAIHHGVENHQENCVIQIDLYVRLGLVHFRIANPLLAGSKAKHGHGLGLSSTRERLDIFFGREASVNTQSLPDRFMAEIIFPDDSQ
ncbi:histidine kinase [Undibacterium sp. LX40W]|uniref:Histidine kinase n=1 Tax=Undibacterium nitidum TaxID=2762298 RepID=A0A923KT49_9BURK|nr:MULTISPECIES: histidine kinase [Undibacterium]MBC3881911.1 histidine kinase [Undibacterium nitidum]MBC3892092.1 histidine kinase [Undibacterium sp. LX40W]